MANGKTKKSKKKIIIFSVIGVLLVALVLIAILGSKKDEITQVQVEKAKVRTITQVVTATGKVNSEFQVIITPEVTGEIVSLPVKEGQQVSKGQQLIKIKGDIYAAQKDRAAANLLVAQSSVTMRQAEFEKIKQDYNRMKELHAKKLVSDAELENAKSLYLTAEAQIAGAQANVSQSRASLQEINEQIYKTTINAPMAGTVSNLSVELGERVLGSGFSQGTTLMTIADLNNMEATVEVDENDVVLISIGDTARVKVDAFSDKEFAGVVTEIGNSAKTENMGTQQEVVNFNVKIKIFNPESKLRPGMSCTAEIETETKENVLSIPIQSVTARNEEVKPMDGEGEEEEESKVQIEKKQKSTRPDEIVFLAENGKAKKRVVKTGLSDDDYIEITEGLKEGDLIVIGNYKAVSQLLNDGSAIKYDDDKKKKEKDSK